VVTLYNRLGAQAMALGAGPLHARTSSGATGILDLDSGQRREPTCQDLADATRLADVPATTVDVHTVRLALANTVKPVGYVCLNEQLLESILAMVATVVGGEEALRQRPIDPLTR
jgi:trimethylamine:corrinoid methyltransferase-like protein